MDWMYQRIMACIIVRDMKHSDGMYLDFARVYGTRQ